VGIDRTLYVNWCKGLQEFGELPATRSIGIFKITSKVRIRKTRRKKDDKINHIGIVVKDIDAMLQC
jgi:hypothetical protein